jgi:hypothetical protein
MATTEATPIRPGIKVQSKPRGRTGGDRRDARIKDRVHGEIAALELVLSVLEERTAGDNSARTASAEPVLSSHEIARLEQLSGDVDDLEHVLRDVRDLPHG